MDEFDLQLPQNLPPKNFTPGAVHYSHVGDMLNVYWKDDPAFARQISPQVTLMIAFDTREVVGVKITDVKAMVEAPPQ